MTPLPSAAGAPVVVRCRRRPTLMAAGLLLSVLAACGSPTTPTPTPPPPPPPPPANTAPVVQSIGVSVTTRTEVDIDVTVTAAVTDAETGADALTYQWTASAGTITGSGPVVTWRLSKNAGPTPVDVVISLAVLESYPALENGAIVTKQHRVEASAPSFRVHDSDGEIRALTLAFLGKFVDNNVSAAAAVSDFSNACPGKEAEFDDVQFIRDTRTVVASSFSVQAVILNGDRTAADIVAPCRFESIVNATGAPEDAPGTCLLTAVYEVNVWKLCSSNFAPAAFSPLGEVLSGRNKKDGKK